MALRKGVLANTSHRNKVIPVKVTLFCSSTVSAERVKVEPKRREYLLTFYFIPALCQK